MSGMDQKGQRLQPGPFTFTTVLTVRILAILGWVLLLITTFIVDPRDLFCQD